MDSRLCRSNPQRTLEGIPVSDIEDEVKCSECPNARHGFDRDASHNEDRYVCQCESHKCTAESLRQQLAEANVEIERLNFKLQNQALDCIAADGQAFDSWQQLAASQAVNQQLREALIVCVCAMQDYQAGIGITEMFDKGENLGRLALQSVAQDTTALSAMIAKAGEVMRERCANSCIDRSIGTDPDDFDEWDQCNYSCAEAIRALHVVTLNDIK